MKKSRTAFWRGWEKIYKILLVLMPAVLYFSYYPLLRFGSSETMNFELSIPLLWLVVFGVVALVLVVKNNIGWWISRKWWVLLFPIFATLSVLWSGNIVRGVLTMGILWLLIIAVASFVFLRDKIWDFWVRKWFWRVFYVSGLVICGWCLLQCVLDLAGVSREVSLMCAGCTYTMFGFPHPNGFAIEPQFMGNLLIAPAFLAGVSFVNVYARKNKQGHPSDGICNTVSLAFGNSVCSKKCVLWCSGILYLMFMIGLFLTFSRGAIYAFGVMMIIFTVWKIRRGCGWWTLVVWPMMFLAFLFTLNLQGVFAQVSRTDDAYFDGVAKVLNHLSLGIIDVREEERGANGEFDEKNSDSSTEPDDAKGMLDAKKQQEEKAVFDGYVEESTDARVRLTEMALRVWGGDWKTMVFGVGVGGAGVALYQSGLMDSPKEIVQNEYASLLLETGLMGVLLLGATFVMLIRIMQNKHSIGIVGFLMVGYGISLCFFSGLPNALHIYLLLGVLMSYYGLNVLSAAKARVCSGRN